MNVQRGAVMVKNERIAARAISLHIPTTGKQNNVVPAKQGW